MVDTLDEVEEVGAGFDGVPFGTCVSANAGLPEFLSFDAVVAVVVVFAGVFAVALAVAFVDVVAVVFDVEVVVDVGVKALAGGGAALLTGGGVVGLAGGVALPLDVEDDGAVLG